MGTGVAGGTMVAVGPGAKVGVGPGDAVGVGASIGAGVDGELVTQWELASKPMPS